MIRVFGQFSIILVAAVVAVACSSSPGVTPTTIDGNYEVERYDFEPDGFNMRVSVLDSLELLNMEIFGEDQEFLLRYRFPDEGTSRVRGSVDISRNSVQFHREEGDLTRILLPAESFTMRVRDDGNVLTIDTHRERVDLRPFGISQSSIDGRLNVRMIAD